MASSEVTSALSTLESPSTPQQNRSAGYNELLGKIVADSEPAQLSENLIAFLNSILGESLGIVSSRPLLGSFVQALKSIPNAQVKIAVWQHALEALQPRVVSFEEQDVMIRELLADAYEEEEDYTSSAKVLQGIQLDSSQRTISDDEKVKTWIRIVRLYLEEDDTTSAESYLNRAKNLLYKVQDTELKLMFQLCQARILDARRKFLDASEVYRTVSLSAVLAEEERLRALSSAIICAVLAPAGPQRSRTLGRLYKDDRASQVEEYGILEKMFLDRLLSPDEVSRFAEKLSPHQLAQTADGSTVLAKAVIEHNLLGASRLYNNIGIDELGILLGLDGDKAEEYAARMVEQGRLSGRIDQIDRLIFFDGTEATGEKTNAGQKDRVTGSNLRKWDTNVQALAEEVERVTTLLQNQFPVRNLYP
ncbi:MAG: hypothetical protein M1830_004193 [Pleopsidium flavum]|nr:MAG: hypothetical protein M1830_004193 [Pleopsidium flavum]